jgi:hypothetical protein
VLLITACTSGGSSDQADAEETSASAGQGASEAGATQPTANGAADPFAGAWEDDTSPSIGKTADWTNKVALADLDEDGDVDLLFANGGDYETPGKPVASTVFLNDGAGNFRDATRQVFGDFKGLTRVIQVGDVDGDGHPDLLVGTTYNTQSRLFLNTGQGQWSDVTDTHLPRTGLSVGDLELGDADEDDDLDIVLADWGNKSPMKGAGPVVLWLNDGRGRFSAAAKGAMPTVPVGFSWDLELVDVDNDWDLDVAISCKVCPTSRLYLNNGVGHFKDATKSHMPAFENNYEFAPIDLDADGFLDLVTINDGASQLLGLPEHVFRNDGTGRYVDVTDDWWPEAANPGYDDNVAVALDVESDGDADFLVGSLDGPDRLLVNDGTGHLVLHENVLTADMSLGTLGMAVADLNGDKILDVVEGQGEVTGHEDERIYFGTSAVPPDTAPPVIRAELTDGVVLARIHDNKTPNSPADWTSVLARWAGARATLTWYGENLFRVRLPSSANGVQVCAIDAAGNRSCAPAR